ncbi:aminopeptidase P family protein [Alcaligenaceae bacterium CGII-47]|nr:aminopeptidase P family protein [Alcaligenaceae bacterium CGII-47]
MNGLVQAQRLGALRARLHESGLDACIIPSSDPHLSEYLPEHWQARAWLSGFSGSAGSVLVTADFAGLWTDGRYWVQATHELEGSGIVLMRAGADDVPDMMDWLVAHVASGARVAVDGRVLAEQTRSQWQAALDARQSVLVLDQDPVGAVWVDRAALPVAPIYEHVAPYACRTRAANLAALREAMRAQGAQWHLLCTLDDIAWLLNLRGSDVSYNPVFLAHVLVGEQSVQLFVAPDKVEQALVAVLARDGVQVHDYTQVAEALAALPADQLMMFDPARVTAGTLAHARHVRRVEAVNPSHLLKSLKTPAEAQHIRRTMEQDGAALCEFFAWLEAAQRQGERITELDVDVQITAARARRPGFVSPSFATIAGFNGNGAMPHYQATPETHSAIEGDGLLLIDSGGQYLGGTTDITRVVPVGQLSRAQKADFTRVLKGHIALARAVFPDGTPSPMLDTLARMPLWQAGLDYSHGTGHGVGYFLNVHEGPQAIAVRARTHPNMAMREGMVTSNEPGLYRPDQWGIRIENLVLAVSHQRTEFGHFLCFETVTLCPIDTRCIEVDELDATERQWLNDYHAQVRERLAPHVQGAALDWLMLRTEVL